MDLDVAVSLAETRCVALIPVIISFLPRERMARWCFWPGLRALSQILLELFYGALFGFSWAFLMCFGALCRLSWRLLELLESSCSQTPWF